MGKTLHLRVLTPAETVIDIEEVAWMQARLADGGGISIYPGHAPLIAETITAPLRYADRAGEQTLDLGAGILVVDTDGATVFTSGEMQPCDDGEAWTDPEAQFDRLAQALLATMRAQPREMRDLGLSLEDEGQ